MKTMHDVIVEQIKNRYDCIKQDDGTFYYYIWQPSSIVENGVVVALGKKYHKDIMHISYDKMDILDIIPIDEDEYEEKYYFVNDAAAWAEAIGIKNVDGLIGLSSNDFRNEVNRRFKLGI